MRSAGLLAENQRSGRFMLTAQLLSLDRPFIGIDMTVTASVLYTLTEAVAGKELRVKTITLPYTAKFRDSLIGVERLRLANEGAARTNIQRLVEWLATYKPQTP